ncbi:MAG TPA: aldehyde dehydrogenase family protein [Solirubrobacterales bacterium]|jgi:acyl-CoA reductase-like NAD-dependent aldehyde dehydrogenase|nr:aldehyde dehydrogenase family protein [Solirubrobacterales bacterium]
MATETIEATDHKLLVAGERLETGEWSEVKSPYDGTVVGRVPKADASVVETAVAAASEASSQAGFPQYARAEVLDRAAQIVSERVEDLAITIAAEAGKPIKTARIEAQRCVGTLTFSAVEARKLTGEMVPMEAGAAGEGKLGLVLRVPYGVVGAISPFNFPLNLVAHKLGPAIAAGNAVVLKPAGQTPISAIKLAEILYEAGLPENWLHVVTGSGSEVGNAIVESDKVGAITFTGSAPVGWGIRAKAAHKKVNLELGSTAPLVVNDDGDWEEAADKAKVHAFSHAGQSCISVQRILVHESIADEFTSRFVDNVSSLVTGDPMDEGTDVGPLISPDDRDRVKSWVDEAVAAGGELLTGGELVDDGRCLAPTVLREPPRDAKVWCDEIFGPVATVHRYSAFDEALGLANDAKFGLQAGVYTRDIGRGIAAAEALEFGGVLINEVPTFRTDQMPYGGVKDSGNTREGPAYAVRELTEERLVTLQG